MVSKTVLLGLGIVLLLLGILAKEALTTEQQMRQVAKAVAEKVAFKPETKGTLRTAAGIKTATFLVGANARVLSYDILSIELEDGRIIQSQKSSLGEIPKGGAVTFSVQWKDSGKDTSTNPTAILSYKTFWNGGVHVQGKERVTLQRRAAPSFPNGPDE